MCMPMCVCVCVRMCVCACVHACSVGMHACVHMDTKEFMTNINRIILSAYQQQIKSINEVMISSVKHFQYLANQQQPHK